MRIKDAGFSLTALTDLYRENRVCAGESPQGAKASAGISSSSTSHRVGKGLAAGRTDKIEITGYPKKSGSVPEKIGKDIRQEVCKDADPERLEKLRSTIASGKYSIDSTELAHLLLTDQ